MLAFAKALPQQINTYWRQIKRHKLISNAGIYVSGYVAQKAMAFILIPVWARFLTPEDYGITGTMTAYSGVISILLAMGLQDALIRYYYEYTSDPSKQKNFVSSMIIFQLTVPAIIILAFNLWGPLLWARYMSGNIPFNPYVRLMLLTAYTNLLIQISACLYQAQQKARQFIYLQYGIFLLTTITALILVVGLRLGAYGQMLASLTASALVATVVVYLTARTWFTRQIDWQYVRKALVYGLPLVPHLIASWVLLAADRVILDHFVSLEEIGLYNVAYMLGIAIDYLISGIRQAWVPYYFNVMQTDPQPDRKVVKFTSMYVAVIGGGCSLGVLFIGDMVHVMLPPSYHAAVPYIVPVMLGYLLMGFYSIGGLPIAYYKKTYLLPFLTAIAALLNILLNILLVPLYGAMASAWITTFTYAVFTLLFFLAGRRYDRIRYPLGRYGLIVGSIFLMAFITTQLGMLNIVSLLIKTGLIVLYAVGAYLLLVLPYNRSKSSSIQLAGE